MDSFPWYLLAIGIGIVVVGSLLASLSGPPDRGQRAINPRMRDNEIIRDLKRGQRVTLPNLVILVGLMCILVSICWRITRAFL